uniref:Uncharacterized protein n=2 Tax=unclassified Caudoviricetes TaxID=2788787 RepID=A0A8S5QJG4_9CAUD|nr:MAG TPA: hypothetical protein [Siphoviridae sp. ctL053]DAE18917.1 MAG TPA: hypothetical protein [Siphoviridae sp. ctNPp8]
MPNSSFSSKVFSEIPCFSHKSFTISNVENIDLSAFLRHDKKYFTKYAKSS